MKAIISLEYILKKIESDGRFESESIVDDVYFKISIVDVNRPLVFTFSNAAEITTSKDLSSGNYSPWAFDFVKKRDLNIISFSSFEHEGWYRSTAFHEYLENCLSEVSLLFPLRLSYGSSMGGFAASVFANTLSVDQMLLINPISSLSHKHAAFESRFKYGSSLNWNGRYSDGSIGVENRMIINSLSK